MSWELSLQLRFETEFSFFRLQILPTQIVSSFVIGEDWLARE